MPEPVLILAPVFIMRCVCLRYLFVPSTYLRARSKLRGLSAGLKVQSLRSSSAATEAATCRAWRLGMASVPDTPHAPAAGPEASPPRMFAMGPPLPPLSGSSLKQRERRRAAATSARDLFICRYSGQGREDSVNAEAEGAACCVAGIRIQQLTFTCHPSIDAGHSRGLYVRARR